jgi:hypothetical protein
MSVRLSACLSPADRLQLWDFYEIWYLNIFKKSVQKTQVLLKSNTGTLHENLRTFTISRLIRMINVLDKCRVNQNHHFITNTLLTIIVPFMR